jgi:methylisocitrate lyase
MPEILNQSRNMARAVKIPLLVDVDTGYGNALSVMRTVREFESAGLAGIFFEDQTFPKRCGHFEGKKIITVEEMVTKIKAACSARNDKDFVIIARTDARAITGIDDAIARSKAFVKAGADIIFVEAMLSEAEMKKVTRSVKAPLQANLNESSKTPMLPYQDLHKMGFKLISYSGTLQRTAIKGMQSVLEVLKREGSTLSAYPDQIASLIDRSELLGLQQFYELEERLYGPLMDSEGSWREALAAKAKQTRKPGRNGKQAYVNPI